MIAARLTYLREDCAAREFLDLGFIATSIAQRNIIHRSREYANACMMWATNIACQTKAEWMDHQRCNDLARMAATLAFLAFPDLRDELQMKEVA